MQLSHQLMFYTSLDRQNNLRTQVINPQNHAMFVQYPTPECTSLLTCWMLSQTRNFKRSSGVKYFRQIALIAGQGLFWLLGFFVLFYVVCLFLMLLIFWFRFLKMRKPVPFKTKNIEGNIFKSLLGETQGQHHRKFLPSRFKAPSPSTTANIKHIDMFKRAETCKIDFPKWVQIHSWQLTARQPLHFMSEESACFHHFKSVRFCFQ